MWIFYNLFLLIYRIAISFFARWDEKAKAWISGRKNWEGKLQIAESSWTRADVYWMHCASLGEFEQGRPVLEALRQQYPDCKIVLTFFSPSGYEVRKDYSGADYVCYMPMDGRRNAKRFLELVHPKMALFVKYEFWHYYLTELKARNIPSILVSGAFREDQVFFKWWGGFFRKMLQSFTVLTVQDEKSFKLLEGIGISAVITGDTRYDRVVSIASEARRLPKIELFRGESNIVIAGSTWPKDEFILNESLAVFPKNWKLILAPHEIDSGHLRSIKNLFGNDCVFLSEYEQGNAARVLVIDNIGMLSSLYRYGEIAFIGGGFDKGGIHNILEPAVFGLPVIVGPVFEKFSEAREMEALGFAFPVKDSLSYSQALEKMINDSTRATLNSSIRQFVSSKAGATQKILNLITHLK